MERKDVQTDMSVRRWHRLVREVVGDSISQWQHTKHLRRQDKLHWPNLCQYKRKHATNSPACMWSNRAHRVLHGSERTLLCPPVNIVSKCGALVYCTKCSVVDVWMGARPSGCLSACTPLADGISSVHANFDPFHGEQIVDAGKMVGAY